MCGGRGQLHPPIAHVWSGDPLAAEGGHSCDAGTGLEVGRSGMWLPGVKVGRSDMWLIGLKVGRSDMWLPGVRWLPGVVETD